MNEYLFMLTETDIASKAFYKNITLLPGSSLGENLFGEFSHVPAIICGEGYSLSKELPLIKNHENRAILFAAGVAVHLLNRNGIMPNFGVCSDPSQVQEVRFLTHFSYEVPFFYLSTFCPEAAEKIHGPRLFLADLTEGDMARWFYEALGLPIFQENLTNAKEFYLAAALACRMKCDPVIFVGIDDIPEAEQAAVIQELREKYPETQLITTAIASTYSMRSYDLKNWIHAKIEERPMTCGSHEKVLEVLGIWNESLKRCYEEVDLLLKELCTIREQCLSGNASPPHSSTEKKMMHEANLNQEIAYKNLLVHYNRKFESLPPRELIKLSHFPKEFEEKRQNLGSLGNEIEKYESLKLFLDIHKKNCSESLKICRKNLESSQEIETLNTSAAPPQSKPPRHETYEQGNEKLIINAQGALHGPTSFYHKEGALSAQGYFVEDRQEGKNWQYYLGGQLYSLTQYKNGLEEGKQEYYNKNGHLKTLLNYRRGKLDGEVHLYYPNGKAKRTLNFKEGQLYGKDLIWNEEGTLILETEYKENHPVGISKTWYSNGQPAKEIRFYEHGKFDLYLWNESGQLAYDYKASAGNPLDVIVKKSNELKKSLEEATAKLLELEQKLFKKNTAR
jgi:antitoxin component YwqK of YwqJK toxin-antitoxin module